MKMLNKVIGTLIVAALPVGCATNGPNQTGGTLIGGASGALIGGAISHSAGGAVVGGAIGALTGALVGKDIDESTRTRVAQGQPLTLEDIKALSKSGIGDNLIISQINSTRTVYMLNSAQIIDLKNSGVSQGVIDYMINTQSTFAAQPPQAPTTTYYYVAPAPYPYYYYPYPRYYYYGPHRGGHYDHGHRR